MWKVTLPPPPECWQDLAGNQHLDHACNAKHSASLPSATEEMHSLARGPHSTTFLAYKVPHHWKNLLFCTWEEQRSRRSGTMDVVLNVTYCVNELNRALRKSGNN